MARSHPHLLTPRLTPYIPHQPTAKQAAFLLLDGREALFGGAAGGGKSDALLMAALQYVDFPGYAAILLRRTFTDLALPGALLDRAASWLAGTPARWHDRGKTWTFPSGATLSFGYLDHPRQRYRYQSSEFQFVGFDELTQFRETDYVYLFSRLRKRASLPVPLRMRAASNPGGLGHDWVRRRFLVEGRAQGRFFVPARLDDNPYLDRAAYVQSLQALDTLTRAQLLGGDWDAHDDGLLSFDMLRGCEADCLWPLGKMPTGLRHQPELYLGVDIGRTRDLTVLWTWEKIGDVCWCREILALANTCFARQRAAVQARLRRSVVRCAIDKGGIGYQLAEELEAAYPGLVEGVQLTAGVQGRLAQRLAVGFAEKRLRIPAEDTLRDDLRLVRKTRIVGGINQVETARGGGSHADRFWAAALAYDAALASSARVVVPSASLPQARKR